jgi:hypothetical protein
MKVVGLVVLVGSRESGASLLSFEHARRYVAPLVSSLKPIDMIRFGLLTPDSRLNAILAAPHPFPGFAPLSGNSWDPLTLLIKRRKAVNSMAQVAQSVLITADLFAGLSLLPRTGACKEGLQWPID